MLAREEYDRFMGIAEKMDERDGRRDKRYLARAAENRFFVLSLSKVESFWEHAGFRMQSIYPTGTDFSRLNLHKTSFSVNQSARRDYDCVLII